MIIPSIWKLATMGAGVISLGLMTALGASYFENKDLLKQRNSLTASINDPKTGYIAQLAQATTNVETLKAQVTKQTTAYNALSKESQDRLRLLTEQLRVAQVETRQMEVKLDRFLSTKPKGVTLEDRVRDIDTRAMAEFVK